ncbi:MAG: NAD-dependent epimerase/dehydratase family protein [Candidatus Helarchaeota archaeon]
MIEELTILVTGAAGFIGSSLIDKLLKYNNEIIGIDNLITGNFDNLSDAIKNPKFKFIKGNICNENIFNKLKNIQFDIVFHQAAIVSVSKSLENPIFTNINNVSGTLNLLEFARKKNIEKFIYASSSSVYGESTKLPKVVSMITKPISPYGVSKLTGECYTYAYYKSYGLKTVSLRYFNVYGPRQAYNNYSGVITIFFNRVMTDKAPIIFGTGEQTRDFTYIDDVIDANILAALNKGIEGKVFNVAYGKQISISDLANKIITLLNKKLKPIYQDPRPGDILHSLADISETKQYLNYTPKYNIDIGLKKYYNWLLKTN